MDAEHAAAGLACAITVALFAPYLLRVWQGKLAPRPASWVVWGLCTLMVGFGQLLAGGGVGALPILLSGALSGGVACLAFRLAMRTPAVAMATTGDRWCLVAAVCCLPLWMATGDPLWSVLILTGIDLIGFIPTIRAIRRDPHSESTVLFTALGLRNLIAIAALEERNLTTMVFPAVIGFACLTTALQIAVGCRLAKRARPCLTERPIAS